MVNLTTPWQKTIMLSWWKSILSLVEAIFFTYHIYIYTYIHIWLTPCSYHFSLLTHRNLPSDSQKVEKWLMAARLRRGAGRWQRTRGSPNARPCPCPTPGVAPWRLEEGVPDLPVECHDAGGWTSWTIWVQLGFIFLIYSEYMEIYDSSQYVET